MSLTQELDNLRSQSRTNIPADKLEILDKAAEKLGRSGISEHSVKVGDKAPEFVLPNAVGKTVRLKDLLVHGPVVVSFYRGLWCPNCNLELRALEQTLPEITSLGATLVAISPQTPDNSLSTAEKHHLTFEVLSDVGNQVAREYGLVFQIPEELRPIYESFGMDLSAHNGDESFELPVPATYVLDTAGTVRTAFVNPDYTKRLDPADVVSALRVLEVNSLTAQI